MEEKFDHCPNCNSKIKVGTFSSIELIEKGKTQLINNFTENKAKAFCTNCFAEPYNSALNKFYNEFNQNSESLKSILPYIPVITLQQPLNWS